MKIKKKLFTLFSLGYGLAILAWFSYSSLYGLDMMNFNKLAGNQKIGSHYSSMHHK